MTPTQPGRVQYAKRIAPNEPLSNPQAAQDELVHGTPLKKINKNKYLTETYSLCQQPVVLGMPMTHVRAHHVCKRHHVLRIGALARESRAFPRRRAPRLVTRALLLRARLCRVFDQQALAFIII